jgi:hypothetical protein
MACKDRGSDQDRSRDNREVTYMLVTCHIRSNTDMNTVTKKDSMAKNSIETNVIRQLIQNIT